MRNEFNRDTKVDDAVASKDFRGLPEGGAELGESSEPSDTRFTKDRRNHDVESLRSDSEVVLSEVAMGTTGGADGGGSISSSDESGSDSLKLQVDLPSDSPPECCSSTWVVTVGGMASTVWFCRICNSTSRTACSTLRCSESSV